MGRAEARKLSLYVKYENDEGYAMAQSYVSPNTRAGTMSG